MILVIIGGCPLFRPSSLEIIPSLDLSIRFCVRPSVCPPVNPSFRLRSSPRLSLIASRLDPWPRPLTLLMVKAMGDGNFLLQSQRFQFYFLLVCNLHPSWWRNRKKSSINLLESTNEILKFDPARVALVASFKGNCHLLAAPWPWLPLKAPFASPVVESSLTMLRCWNSWWSTKRIQWQARTSRLEMSLHCTWIKMKRADGK